MNPMSELVKAELEAKRVSRLLMAELDHLLGQVNNPHTCMAVRDRVEALLGKNDYAHRYLDVYVRASKVDPTVMIVAPLNVLTGMLMMGHPYPHWDIPRLLGKRYEDHNGVWEAFTDLNGDPCFTFTPRPEVVDE